MDKDFSVTKKGTTLEIMLGKELSTANAELLEKELSAYYGQDIKKLVFNATQLLYISSSGIRTIVYAKKKLISQPSSVAMPGADTGLVFMNCAKAIKDTLDLVGFSSSITYVNVVNNKSARQQSALDNFSVNNDVVCLNMKMGKEEE